VGANGKSQYGAGLLTGRATRDQKRQQNYSIQNGNIVNGALTPMRTMVITGLTMMETMSIMPYVHKQVATGRLANMFLTSMNCTVSTEQVSFSLLANQTDTETVANPNILDSKLYAMLEPDMILALDKFTSPGDPFYTSDEPITQGVIDYTKKTKGKRPVSRQRGGDINKITSYIIQRSVSPQVNGGKYFDNDLTTLAKERIKY